MDRADKRRQGSEGPLPPLPPAQKASTGNILHLPEEETKYRGGGVQEAGGLG